MHLLIKYSRRLIELKNKAQAYDQLIKEIKSPDENLEKIKEVFRLKRKKLQLNKDIQELEELIAHFKKRTSSPS